MSLIGQLACIIELVEKNSLEFLGFDVFVVVVDVVFVAVRLV